MKLSAEELTSLFTRVFSPDKSCDHSMAILVDVPGPGVPDNEAWASRRAMALEWRKMLLGKKNDLGLEVNLFVFACAGKNNADLPELFWRWESESELPRSSSDLEKDGGELRDTILSAHPIHVALTEFSATAPLKNFAKEHGTRGATMPGFRESMIPALRLDYDEISHRVGILTDLLNKAAKAKIVFDVRNNTAYHLMLDLRHRKAHPSSGLFTQPGQVGNLPSGESYIVPYEGERTGDSSVSEGYLPVQFGDEVVVYEIRQNVAVSVISRGEKSAEEGELLAREPAYGNIAELGLGVLGHFGLEPSGEILLDEKLGLHIAFGRSDHFGGRVSPESFKDPKNVVHIDRVYVPGIQPKVGVLSLDLVSPEGKVVALMRDNQYIIDFKKGTTF